MRLRTKLLQLKQKLKKKDSPVKVTFEKDKIDFGLLVPHDDVVITVYKFLLNWEKKLLMNYEKEGVELLKMILRDYIIQLEKHKFDINKIKKIY